MNDNHDRTVNNVVGWTLAAAFAACCWWTLALPAWIPAIVNPLLVVAVAYGLARWKRSRFGWVMFWVLLGVQVVGVVMDALSAFTGHGPSEVAGAAVLALAVWLVRLPRFRPAEVSHVVHHHVVQGDAVGFPSGAGLPPGFSVTQLPEAAESVEAARRPAVPGRVLRAIEAPGVRVPPLGRFGEVAERVRRHRLPGSSG